jgi:hypothetical protein
MTLAIPASQLVNIVPGVIGAGGSALDLSGLILTFNTRVPIGTVASFTSAAAVAAFFGQNTIEANLASTYFSGYTNGTMTPGALLFAQYPWKSAVGAYLRGGGGLTLAQVQAITSGVLTLTIDGANVTSASFNLSAAGSYSAAAALIQTALASQDASFTGVLAPAVGVTANTSTISGTTLTVVTQSSGSNVPGAVLTGTGVTAGTTIVSQLAGTQGGAGTYQVSVSQTVSATAITATNAAQALLTASSVTGTIAAGQSLNGVGVTAGSAIVSQLTGTVGGAGVYIVTPSQTVSSEAMTAGLVTVTYDSASAAFVIASGSTGPNSTIGFATGSASATLLLTAATGATLSQGAAIASPASFMANVVQQTQNFASFMTAFEPVTADKIAFAAWNNTTSPIDRYVYAMWSTDVTDTTNTNTSSAIYAILQAGYSGTAGIYAPINKNFAAAFLCGFIASVNFQQTNGRASAAYKIQSGLPADVTSGLVAPQLLLNGMNFIGQYSAANSNYTWLQNGQITGPFLWIDSYIDQIWLNNQLQIALLALLGTIGSVPYNPAGYALIDAACADPINAALNFGAIRPNVNLSALQLAEINTIAGKQVASTVQSRGWYLNVVAPSAQVRIARGSPLIQLFYTDGQSIQTISLSSEEVQ